MRIELRPAQAESLADSPVYMSPEIRRTVNVWVGARLRSEGLAVGQLGGVEKFERV